MREEEVGAELGKEEDNGKGFPSPLLFLLLLRRLQSFYFLPSRDEAGSCKLTFE